MLSVKTDAVPGSAQPRQEHGIQSADVTSPASLVGSFVELEVAPVSPVGGQS